MTAAALVCAHRGDSAQLPDNSLAALNRLKRPVVVVNICGTARRVTRARIPTLGRTALSLAREISLAHG